MSIGNNYKNKLRTHQIDKNLLTFSETWLPMQSMGLSHISHFVSLDGPQTPDTLKKNPKTSEDGIVFANANYLVK